MGRRARKPLIAAAAWLLLSLLPAAATAQEGWKAEFDAVCSNTDGVTALSVEELKERIARCVELKGRIESQEETVRRVYLRRLQLCCDLHKFMLEEKEKGR